jgi:hypothetical protein
LYDKSDSESDDDESVGGVSVNDEVELEHKYQFTADVRVPESTTSNLLIPEKDLNLFIREDFCCKLCSSPIKEGNLTTVKVGCACSIFWKCCNSACDASDKIIAKKATGDVSESHKRYHPDVPACVGDYDIYRQIVLACQLSGGGARMAPTFGGLTLLSLRSIWLENVMNVE